MSRGERVAVLGGGVAGTAAALAAARAGATVVLIDGGTGASTLSTGAIDDVPWSHAPGAPSVVGPAARGALDALAMYALPDAGARVATTAGVVRLARGHDLAVLDLAPLTERRVGVVSCDRPGWDAAALARTWGRGFVPLEVALLRHVDERLVPAGDFAARHDEEDRLAWAVERLREALARDGSHFDALLLPPSLGVEQPRARALSARVGLPCGEATGLPGGPSGLRFERARDRALAAARVEVTAGRATGVKRRGATWRVELEDDGAPIDAVAVVLAVGGLVGGGLLYTPGDAAEASVLPPAARAPFQLGLEVAGAPLGAHGQPLEQPGSLFGSAPESIAWPFAAEPLIERVGILVDDAGRAAPGLYAAGEVVADGARTWLRALESGSRAGAAAARELLSATAERSPSASAAPASRP